MPSITHAIPLPATIKQDEEEMSRSGAALQQRNVAEANTSGMEDVKPVVHPNIMLAMPVPMKKGGAFDDANIQKENVGRINNITDVDNSSVTSSSIDQGK